jgi:flagellar P-ring protein precursor FlgI
MSNSLQTNRTQFFWLLISLVLILFSAVEPARAERIKDLASVAGVRANQLVGYGLVVGLDGTGDRTTQAPGTLLLTPLKGLDGETYAIAQGNLVVVGLSAEGRDGSNISINVPSVGRIPNGATVERSVPNNFAQNGFLTLNLNRADFTTASRLATSVNNLLGEGTAQAIDAISVRIIAPGTAASRTAFISTIENIAVDPGLAAARVIVNARTGTVVISSGVTVLPAAVSHGTLTVSISEDFDVSQPGPFARRGDTVTTPDSRVDVGVDTTGAFMVKGGTDLNEVVQAINEVGAGPADVVAILQALKEAGALRAELIII